VWGPSQLVSLTFPIPPTGVIHSLILFLIERIYYHTAEPSSLVLVPRQPGIFHQGLNDPAAVPDYLNTKVAALPLPLPHCQDMETRLNLRVPITLLSLTTYHGSCITLILRPSSPFPVH